MATACKAAVVTSPHWQDEAISRAADDAFGRADYARRAANLIAHSQSWDASLVFGLTGPWGSGKSSLISMLVESLEREHGDWVVARFTPWAAADVTGLLGEFYSSLARALPQERGANLRKALGRLAQVSAPAASMIPLAGASVEQALKLAGEHLAATPSWDAAFRTASQRMRELNVPLLVIADDIDRLQPDELRTLLKVVRLLGRFPGVQYLLAYDESTLFGNLNGSGAPVDYGANFMEKIIQYPLTVPPLLEAQLINRLNTGLANIFTETERPMPETSRISALTDLLRALLRTPRAVDRYLAQVRHHLPMVPFSEVDDGDVLLLTLLRTAFPSVYSQAPRWRRELISGKSEEVTFTAAGIERMPFDVQLLLAEVSPGSRSNAVKLLEALFPRLDATSQPVQGSVKGPRLANENYFDRYFMMGIPDHDVSDETVANAVVKAGQGHGEALAELLSTPDVGRAFLVVEKVREQSLEGWSVEQLLLLAARLADSVDSLAEESTLFFSAQERVISFLGSLLIRAGTPTESSAVLSALSGASTATRYQVIERAERDFAKTVGGGPDWLKDVISSYAAEAVDSFLRHLDEGDGAAEAPTRYWASFAGAHGRREELRTKVALAVAGTLASSSLEDLAARVVGLHAIISPNANWQLGDPDQVTWNWLAPNDDDSWYDLDVEDGVDRNDLSWSNRRRYVRGRLRRPSISAVEASG
jgi:hypothetical protein